MRPATAAERLHELLDGRVFAVDVLRSQNWGAVSIGRSLLAVEQALKPHAGSEDLPSSGLVEEADC